MTYLQAAAVAVQPGDPDPQLAQRPRSAGRRWSSSSAAPPSGTRGSSSGRSTRAHPAPRLTDAGRRCGSGGWGAPGTARWRAGCPGSARCGTRSPRRRRRRRRAAAAGPARLHGAAGAAAGRRRARPDQPAGTDDPRRADRGRRPGHPRRRRQRVHHPRRPRVAGAAGGGGAAAPGGAGARRRRLPVLRGRPRPPWTPTATTSPTGSAPGCAAGPTCSPTAGSPRCSRRSARRSDLPARILARPDGDRTLTDLRHIGQLLHAAQRSDSLGLSALVSWLRHRIAESSGDQAEDRTPAAGLRRRRGAGDDRARQQGPGVPGRVRAVRLGLLVPGPPGDPAAARRRRLPRARRRRARTAPPTARRWPAIGRRSRGRSCGCSTSR